MDRTKEEKSRAKDVSLHHPAPTPVAIVSSILQPRFRIPLPPVNSMSETSPPDREREGGGEGGGWEKKSDGGHTAGGRCVHSTYKASTKNLARL